ncbi:MAG: hypothetical protein PWP08_1359, partial [Methanofollis sp.]|nr:hypothetical protein [Methanofollis sp.]
IGSRAVKIFTVSGHFIVPLVSFRRVATGEAASALLHRFQRERYDGGIRADRSDFETATRIYAAINGDAGGQETKLTKNEAAALETVEAMGWSVFTIRMLQEALGLSYHQTRRILHGYNNGGSSYTGLLEKCPGGRVRGHHDLRGGRRLSGPPAGAPLFLRPVGISPVEWRCACLAQPRPRS